MGRTIMKIITKDEWDQLPKYERQLVKKREAIQKLANEIRELDRLVAPLAQIKAWHGNIGYNFTESVHDCYYWTVTPIERIARLYLTTSKITYGVYVEENVDHYRLDRLVGNNYTKEQAEKIVFRWLFEGSVTTEKGELITSVQ